MNYFARTLICLLTSIGCSTAFALDYRVDPSGAGGAFTTIQAAINAVAGQSVANRANILIAPGTYNEQLTIAKPFVSLKGAGTGPQEVHIVAGGTGFNPAVYVQGPAQAFMATNLTIESQLLDNHSQGIALRSSADKAAFKNIRLLGYQDTLLVDAQSRQYFQNVFITGDTDFIFGNATAVFDNATIQSTDGNYITAANTERTTANGLIFRDSTLIAGTARHPVDFNGQPASSATANEVFLGRPWQWPDGKVPSTIFINTRMGNHIRSAGWDPWNLTTPGPNTNPDGTTRYSEFGSLNLAGFPLLLGGTGVPTGRVSWADPMTAAQANLYTLENIFGPVSFWNNNPSAQPEGTGVAYLPQGDGAAWDPVTQLTLLDVGSQPLPPQSHVINFDIGIDSHYSGVGVAPDPGTFWNGASVPSGYTGRLTVANVLDSNGIGTTSDILVWRTSNPASGAINRFSTANNSNAQPPALMQDYIFSGPYTIQITDLTPGQYTLYVFAHGDQPNQNSTVALDQLNGAATGVTGDMGTEVRNLFTPNAEGYSYLKLAGFIAPGQSTFTFTTSGYLNGFQLVRVVPEPGSVGMLVLGMISIAVGLNTRPRRNNPPR